MERAGWSQIKRDESTRLMAIRQCAAALAYQEDAAA